MNIEPLYRWAGGKTKLIKHYSKFIPDNIEYYYEPFFGGGAMYNYIQSTRRPKECFISELPEMLGLYEVLKHEIDPFLYELDIISEIYLSLNKPDRKKYYYDIRQSYAYDYQNMSKPKEYAHLYFMMRTCFNGLCKRYIITNNRYGTPCGTLHEKKVYNRDNVMAWHYMLQNTHLIDNNWDTWDWNNIDKNNTVIFIDPPYRNCSVTYDTPFPDTEHDKLLNICRDIKQASIFYCNQYTDDNYYEDRLSHLRMEKFDYTYTSGRKQKGGTGNNTIEILIHNTIEKKIGIDCFY